MSISERVYRILLSAYPRGFRNSFGALMLRHFKDTNGGGMQVWSWIVRDLAAGLLREHLSEWRQQMSKVSLIAATILVLPLGFVLINVLQYELGIPIPWNPYEGVYDQISGTNWTYLFDAVILFSPIVAFLIVVLSRIKISGGEGKAVLARIEIRNASKLAYAVVGISVALLGVMGPYLVVENLL